jgi:[acyl-carrier-protein] S-malonyltransferase
MATVAVCLFPGQGSQRAGMGADLAAAFPSARRVFAEVDERLGFALSRVCFEGPDEELRRTEVAQPAILAASVAAWRVLEETTGIVPAALAGHSLGEWSALVAAGALGLAHAAAAVRERGRLMQAAVPDGEGAMAAVMGLEADAVAALCEAVADGQVVTPANLNGAGQVVVAGHAAAVGRLVERASAEGARAQRLPVSAPFHCSLMAPAAEGLARWLAGVDVRSPRLPVFTSVEARRIAGAGEVRDLLVRQVTAPVRWEETVRAVVDVRPAVALEVGPGRVLTGLLRRIAPEVRGVPAGDAEGLARAHESLA